MVDKASPAGHLPRRLRLGRGLFRLWAILSLLWMIGVAAVYRLEPVRCQHEPIFACILNLYEATMLTAIPVDLAEGNNGLRWDALTPIQQALVANWFAIEQDAIDADLEKLRNNNYEPKVDFYRNLVRKMQIYKPEDLQYKLVPVVDLAPAQTAWFRDTWLVTSQRTLAGTVKEFGVIGVGIPLAVGFVGFVALRVGRWIWADLRDSVELRTCVSKLGRFDIASTRASTSFATSLRQLRHPWFEGKARQTAASTPRFDTSTRLRHSLPQLRHTRRFS